MIGSEKTFEQYDTDRIHKIKPDFYKLTVCEIWGVLQHNLF